MNINFPPVDERFIKSVVEGGYYSNATEFIRDAVRHMREVFDQKYVRLKAALEAGEKDIREGRTVSYTLELLKQIEQDARRHAEEGRKPDPDVCP